ncbi:hypothetical protein [Streptomyces mirabilis]|uniref:hypothetical protein n=1 Tax=Streptomyces mirabilis TaxID=68239 RepID=UPI003245F56E
MRAHEPSWARKVSRVFSSAAAEAFLGVQQGTQDGAAVGGADLGRYAGQQGVESGEGRGVDD